MPDFIYDDDIRSILDALSQNLQAYNYLKHWPMTHEKKALL